MTTCEKCGRDYPQIENTILVESKTKQRRRAALCSSCWDIIHPGEWFVLPGEDDESEEVMRVYWECDFCHNIYQARGVSVLVHLEHTPPRTEYIACAECATARPELQPKPAQGEPQTQELEPVAIQEKPELNPQPTEAQTESQADLKPAPEKALAERAILQSGCLGNSRANDYYHDDRGIQKNKRHLKSSQS